MSERISVPKYFSLSFGLGTLSGVIGAIFSNPPLPPILNCDLKSIPEVDRDGLREVIELKRLKFQLKDNADLNNLRDLAAHRRQWKELAKAIFTAQYNDYFHIKSDRKGKRETRANQKYDNNNFVTGQEYEQIFINELG